MAANSAPREFGQAPQMPTRGILADSRPLMGAADPRQRRQAMAQTVQTDSRTDSSPERDALPHKARSFTALPAPDRASALLAEIASAPCAFAPASGDAPLALYGAGDLGRLARGHLKAVGRDFVMAIDRNAKALALEPAWAGVHLAHPDEVSETAKNDVRVAVSVVTTPYVPLERALAERGFKDIVPFYDLAESFRDRHPLSNGWFAPLLTAQDQANAAKVLALWADDVSRAHHLQFLAWRRLREEWTFERAPPVNDIRFFIPEITCVLRGDEILVDAGAHHGKVIKAFTKQTNGAFRQIVAIEPDAENRARFLENLRAWLPGDARVTVLTCALSDGDGEAPFHPGLDYASQLSPTGTMRVETRKLDALGLAPTFVKLHLEGGELAALKGARQTLLANRPIVAATVYHNADGIWKTPLWLMDTLPDYRFLFRVHSWCGTGAVVYAIPNERTGRA
jgi:FkbM family methyltransferase